MLEADEDGGRWVRTQRGVYGSDAMGGGSVFIMRVFAQVGRTDLKLCSENGNVTSWSREYTER